MDPAGDSGHSSRLSTEVAVPTIAQNAVEHLSVGGTRNHVDGLDITIKFERDAMLLDLAACNLLTLLVGNANEAQGEPLESCHDSLLNGLTWQPPGSGS